MKRILFLMSMATALLATSAAVQGMPFVNAYRFDVTGTFASIDELYGNVDPLLFPAPELGEGFFEGTMFVNTEEQLLEFQAGTVFGRYPQFDVNAHIYDRDGNLVWTITSGPNDFRLFGNDFFFPGAPAQFDLELRRERSDPNWLGSK